MQASTEQHNTSQNTCDTESECHADINTINNIGNSQQLDVYESLLNWSKQRGSEISNVRVGMSATCGCRGLFATTAIPAGEVVLSLSKSATISLQTCCSQIPLLEKRRIADFSAFSYFIAHEMLRGSESPWHTYFAVIPTLDEIHNALALTEEEISRLPEDCSNAVALAQRRALASLQYLQQVAGIAVDPILRSTLNYAMAIMYSRGLSVNGKTMLLPVMDMMNHDPPRACVMSHDALGRITIVAVKDIAPGEEIFVNYGEKTLPELVAYYGFGLP